MKQKILYVDDDQDWRILVADFLRENGFDAMVARDASEAMAFADRETFGLIILDINLAGESGPGLLEFLRLNFSTVPVVLFSGQILDSLSQHEMFKQGALEYLHKGSLPELLEAVKRCLKIE